MKTGETMTYAAFGLALAALGWGVYQLMQARQLAERLENTRTAQYRLHDQVRELRDTVEGLESQTRALQAQLRATTGEAAFTAETTVSDALLIDPRAQQVLGAFHIGGCDSCAVSDTDSLAAVAANSGQSLERILDALNALNAPDGGKVLEMLARKPNVSLDL